MYNMYNKVENTAENHWQRLYKVPKMKDSANGRRVENGVVLQRTAKRCPTKDKK